MTSKLSVLAPLAWLAVLEVGRQALIPSLGSGRAYGVAAALTTALAIAVHTIFFRHLQRRLREVELRERGWAALRSASLDVSSELSLEVVLKIMVEQARNLIGTHYGALAVYDEQGAIQTFVTSGIGRDQEKEIGAPPVGQGLLGVVLHHGQSLRIDDLRTDARSGGFPPNHPPMRSLLAVPVPCRSPFHGNLYLSEKREGDAFSQTDEEILGHFASQAAIAVDNAYLHARAKGLAVVEERLRLAREMHDGEAQVLAYINTKAQAAHELLKAGLSEEAAEHLKELVSATRDVYSDIREGILGLRSGMGPNSQLGDTLSAYVERWRGRCEIATEVELGELPALEADAELQLLRILQEALTNVRKHSHAQRVKVLARAAESSLYLQVLDDGVGFHPTDPSRIDNARFGLATMRERAEAIGATLEVDSKPGAGCRIEVRFPLHQVLYNIDPRRRQEP